MAQQLLFVSRRYTFQSEGSCMNVRVARSSHEEVSWSQQHGLSSICGPWCEGVSYGMTTWSLLYMRSLMWRSVTWHPCPPSPVSKRFFVAHWTNAEAASLSWTHQGPIQRLRSSRRMTFPPKVIWIWQLLYIGDPDRTYGFWDLFRGLWESLYTQSIKQICYRGFPDVFMDRLTS
jgi:hypothetical protein